MHRWAVVRNAGAVGKRRLAAYLAAPDSALAERPMLVRALADAAVAAGEPEARFACRAKLDNPRCLEITKQQREREEANNLVALRDCAPAVSRWLAQP
jgi:hypothetical protein